MKASPIQNSFNAGELSPQLKGQFNLAKYKNGCEVMTNFMPLVHGPARKRPGTRFVSEVKNSANATRLVTFEYSLTQAYVLEFGNNYVRFYLDGGQVVSCMSAYEIVSPYSSADLAQLDYAQSADVVYLAHPNHPPYKLARLGATNWTLTEVAFDWPPFNDQNTTAVTITSNAVTGSVTLTASAATFTASSVGDHIRFEEVIESKYNQWTTGVAVSAGAYNTYQGRLYYTAGGGTCGSRPPIHSSGSESDGAVTWVYQHDGAGYVEVTGYTSTTVVTGTVIKQLPASATSGSVKWSTGAWSPTNGYPRTVTFYEDRLWFAGSLSKPQTLWASVSGDYENHQYGTNDDDALNYTINTQDMNTIQWLSPGKVLAIGTAKGEFTLSATQISDPVTPTNVRIVPQTTFGCALGVRPLRIGSSILFLQRAGRKIREYTYDFQTDSYVAPNMNLLADHITEDGIVDMAYQQEPAQVVWAPVATGDLMGMTYERAEEVVGWHRQDVGGVVESVVSLPHWDGDQDVTFMVVRRTINDSTKRYVEYIEKYRTDEQAFFVDCGLTYDGSPTTSITGLGHLEGETVTILTDGYVHPARTVTAGAVTLQKAASVVHVGLGYTSTVKTMPIEAGSQDGVSQGKTMRLAQVVIRLHETGPGLHFGPDSDHLDELHMRGSGDAMDAPVPLFTGDTEILPWPGEYQKAPQMTIEHRLPLPCTLVALMPQLHTYDR